MSQQINLWRPRRAALPPSLVAGGVIAACALALAVHAARASADLARAQAEAAVAEAQLQRLRQRVAQGAEADNAPKSAEALAAEIRELRARSEAVRPLIEAVRSHSIGATAGYSEPLLVLSRAARQDVWLTQVLLAKGGREMQISGRALEPDAVLQYVRQLNGAFAPLGIRFNHMDLLPEGRAAGRSPSLGFRLS